MEKEIPTSRENTTKGGRLRDTAKQLRFLPLDRVPTIAEWEQLTGELTKDELERLVAMAAGHAERITGAESLADALEEASSAVLLRPLDLAWAAQVAEVLRSRSWQGDEVHAFFAAIERRTGKKARRPGAKLPRWFLPVLVGLVIAPLAAWSVFVLWPGLSPGAAFRTGVGPRTLEASVDTQGVKSNTQLLGSKLILFPEATVAEFSAWVTFPDHQVAVWEGTVAVVDAAGDVLATRDVEFHPSNQGPLEPGQGVEIFQQFDAWPWFDKAAAFQVVTTKILAKATKPRDRKELPVAGLDQLTSGYNLKLWLVGSQWTNQFASRVHHLDLEFENTGLKPFSDLQLVLRWTDDQGKILKTQTIRPVSAFRAALPSGARLGWSQETVFDTEVFPWEPGHEPRPLLELAQWQ